jgi:hypothetical protein
MKVWIEICKKHHGGRLSCQQLSELVRKTRRNGDAYVMHREIDLAYGLIMDRKENSPILFS